MPSRCRSPQLELEYRLSSSTILEHVICFLSGSCSRYFSSDVEKISVSHSQFPQSGRPAIFTIWTGKVFQSHLNINFNKQRITSICVGAGKSKLIFAMCAKRSAGLAAECVAGWQISRLG